jgi:hypothetical protein
LKKKKGVKDQYSIEILSTIAESNPVLAYLLNDLYGIKLPDFINLEEITLRQFYELIVKQIQSSNSGIKLAYHDKPKIQLIHSIAKQTLAQFRKKLKQLSDRATTFKNISHSYTQDNFIPFGLEIYKKRVQPKFSSLEFLINEDIKMKASNFSGDSSSEGKNLFSLVNAENESDPYKWEFDVCNIVLGNFNYKKMSLVRDYNYAIDNHISSGILEDLFSSEPRTIDIEKEDRKSVV